MVLADGTVRGRLFSEGNECDAPRPAVGTVDDSAPHHGTAGAELRGKKIKADLVVEVGDQQLHFPRTRGAVDPSVHRAGIRQTGEGRGRGSQTICLVTQNFHWHYCCYGKNILLTGAIKE